jgi:hypothetical protein
MRPLATTGDDSARQPRTHAEPPAFDDDVWELYDTSTDWTHAHDLAGRPVLVAGQSQTLFKGMGRLSEGSVINL